MEKENAMKKKCFSNSGKFSLKFFSPHVFSQNCPSAQDLQCLPVCQLLFDTQHQYCLKSVKEYKEHKYFKKYVPNRFRCKPFHLDVQSLLFNGSSGAQ